MTNKVLCIIQARMASTRLPNKVLREVSGTPLLEYQINRVKKSKNIDKIVIATSFNSENDVIENFCKKINVDCFRGSEDDVLDRYYQCSQKYPKYNNIMRLTGDCPLIDPALLDEIILFFKNSSIDYANNVPLEGGTYPEGMDAEIFTRDALRLSWKEAKKISEREHVTLHIRNNRKYKKRVPTYNGKDLSVYRLTVDDPEDLEVVSFLMENCPSNASYSDYVRLLDKHPEIRKLNMHLERNEGLKKSLKNDEQYGISTP